MSKKEIQLEVFQCDHEAEDGERCANEGDRDSVKSCHVCHKDLCKAHYHITTVVFLRAGGQFTTGLLQGTRLRFLYYFCSHHSDEFMNTVIEKFGEGEYVPNIGDGTSLV
ncbi:MAG: hypothetical protein RIG61_11270 [Deltaproteobacteria bacterium]